METASLRCTLRTRPYLAILLLAIGSRAVAQDAPGDLPAGKGRETFLKVCSGCHDLATATGERRTRIGWQQNVDDMASRGAEGSDEELQAVVEYLTANFGKINVNTTSAKDLESSLGLSSREAQAVVDYRRKNGNYKNFEELMRTPGVSVEKLQARRNLIAFSL